MRLVSWVFLCFTNKIYHLNCLKCAVSRVMYIHIVVQSISRTVSIFWNRLYPWNSNPFFSSPTSSWKLLSYFWSRWICHLLNFFSCVSSLIDADTVGFGCFIHPRCTLGFTTFCGKCCPWVLGRVLMWGFRKIHSLLSWIANTLFTHLFSDADF